MVLSWLLARNSAFPEGARTMADGTFPVATPLPLAVMAPEPRFIVKGETRLSPCVVTKRKPVPAPTDEVLLPQLARKPSKTRNSRPINARTFIRILSPCFSSTLEAPRQTGHDRGP